MALELGISRDSAPALGESVPLAIVASWWLTGPLDATLRTAWRTASRTGARGSDAFEVGPGLRYDLADAPIRPQLLAGASLVEVCPAFLAPSEVGLRLSVGAALQAYFARDLFVAAVAEASLVVLSSGGGPGLGAALQIGASF